MTRARTDSSQPRILAAGFALSLTMVLSACTPASQQATPTGGSGTTASAGAEAASSAAAASGAPAPSASPISKQTWCQTYIAITNNLGSLGESAEDAAKGLALLPTFEQLWRSAGSMGIVSPAESQANIDTVKAFAEVMKVVADGGTQEQIQQADANFTAGTQKVQGLLTSSAQAVVAACNLASPTASAAKS